MKTPVAQSVALIPIVVIGAVAAIFAASATTLIAAGLEICIVSATVLASARAVWILNAAATPMQAAITPIGVPRQVMKVVSGDRRSPIIDRESGLFVDWYIRLRIEEEIARAERFGQRFSVVRLPASDSAGTAVARRVGASLREVDCAGDLGDAIIVLLPNTDRNGALVWQEKRLAIALDASLMGIKEYPTDGHTLSQLLGEDTWASSRHEFAA